MVGVPKGGSAVARSAALRAAGVAVLIAAASSTARKASWY